MKRFFQQLVQRALYIGALATAFGAGFVGVLWWAQIEPNSVTRAFQKSSAIESSQVIVPSDAIVSRQEHQSGKATRLVLPQQGAADGFSTENPGISGDAPDQPRDSLLPEDDVVVHPDSLPDDGVAQSQHEQAVTQVLPEEETAPIASHSRAERLQVEENGSAQQEEKSPNQSRGTNPSDGRKRQPNGETRSAAVQGEGGAGKTGQARPTHQGARNEHLQRLRLWQTAGKWGLIVRRNAIENRSSVERALIRLRPLVPSDLELLMVPNQYRQQQEWLLMLGPFASREAAQAAIFTLPAPFLEWSETRPLPARAVRP